jgi:hypothetical protein
VSSVLSLTMLAETLRISAPYVCAAIGGIWAERSGVVQIGLEGVLVTSAFSGVAAAHATGSAAIGLAAGVGAGAALSLGHALLVERAKVDAVVSGIALPAWRSTDSTTARPIRPRSRAFVSGLSARAAPPSWAARSPIRSRSRPSRSPRPRRGS